MEESESLSHSKWECKYDVVFIPKCRRRTLYPQRSSWTLRPRDHELRSRAFVA